MVWQVDGSQRSKPNLLLGWCCRDVRQTVRMQEASQRLHGGSVTWRRSASACWGGHSGFLGSGNIKLLQRKKNCEVNAKGRKKKIGGVCFVVNNQWVSQLFSKQRPLDFCFCLIQLCSKGHTYTLQEKESDLYNKRHEAAFVSAAFGSCSSCTEEQLKCNDKAGLVPGVTGKLWDTIPTWACPGLEAVYQSMFTVRLFESVLILTFL